MADVFTHFNYLHTIPEIGMKEFKTSAYVADVLKQLGYEVETQVGGATGVVAVCDSGKPGPVLGLRADMNTVGGFANWVQDAEYTTSSRGHGCPWDERRRRRPPLRA